MNPLTPYMLPIKIIGGVLVAALAVWIVWKLFFAEHAAQAKHDQIRPRRSSARRRQARRPGKMRSRS